MPADDQWPEPPKAFTARGAMLVVTVLLLSAALAFLAIYLRRGRTLRTLDFWGMQNVRLIQNSDALLVFRAGAPGEMPVELPKRDELQDASGIPGISHLREALLTDAHYRWDAPPAPPPTGDWVVLVFADDIPKQELAVAIELDSGWVGTLTGNQQTFLTDRVRQAVERYLAEIENFSHHGFR